jgi:hypothetical protein
VAHRSEELTIIVTGVWESSCQYPLTGPIPQRSDLRHAHSLDAVTRGGDVFRHFDVNSLTTLSLKTREVSRFHTFFDSDYEGARHTCRSQRLNDSEFVSDTHTHSCLGEVLYFIVMSFFVTVGCPLLSAKWSGVEAPFLV